MWDRLASRVAFLESTTPLFLILLLQIAVFSPSLWFAVSADDLVMLSSVAKVDSPWSYFGQDWGFGGGNYRPLLALNAWVSYRVFGVWAFPNHLLNLVILCLNAWLLFRIVKRAQPDRAIIMLAISVGIVSLPGYRVGSGSLGASLLPFTCLLLLVDRFSQDNEKTASPAFVGLVSSVAVLMIESGLVVPLYALWTSRHYPRRPRIGVTTAQFQLMIPFPGTPFYSEMQTNAWLNAEGQPDMPQFSNEQIRAAAKQAYRSFYLSPQYLWKCIRHPYDYFFGRLKTISRAIPAMFWKRWGV